MTHVTFHTLRHFSATALAGTGVPVRTIAGRLGHSNPNLTLRTYAHFLEAADREAAAALHTVTEQLMAPAEAVSGVARHSVRRQAAGGRVIVSGEQALEGDSSHHDAAAKTNGRYPALGGKLVAERSRNAQKARRLLDTERQSIGRESSASAESASLFLCEFLTGVLPYRRGRFGVRRRAHDFWSPRARRRLSTYA
jgi:hypothetical protein